MRRSRSDPRRFSHPRKPLVVGAAAMALSLTALTAVAPPPPVASPETPQARATTNAQSLEVSEEVAATTTGRDGFSTTAGYETLARGGTNYDWAKLVLLYAGWPMSESNVTVITRWMRQENGPDDWWNRNNPLNNGWGSGGGGGLGSYDNLKLAAENAAEALHGNPGYSAIVAGFATSAPTAEIEQAIWASPWATSHYHNGTHWSQREVPRITSSAGTW